MSGTRFAAVAAAVAAVLCLSSCASPVPAMDREQVAQDELPPQVTWPEGVSMDSGTSRLLGHDRDGREYYVTRSTEDTAYCLTVVPAAGHDDWINACGTIPLTLGFQDGAVTATLVPAEYAHDGDEVIGGQVIVTYGD